MKPPEISPREKLGTLLSLFPDGPFRSEDFQIVEPASMPGVYRGLLEHHHHMTVTLELHHGRALRLDVIESRWRDEDYGRTLRLTVPAENAVPESSARRGDRVVLAGIMNIRLKHCGAKVRTHITEARKPLGRILIENEVLRWIEPEAYLRVSVRREPVQKLFGVDGKGSETYGRLATIHCNNEPAVELLEIVAPEDLAR